MSMNLQLNTCGVIHPLRLRTFSTLLLGLCLLLCGVHRSGAQHTEATSSPLASGKWIKISIDKSGLYSISYDQLRSLGFTNPEAVGVYGRGGRLLSESLQKAPASHLPQVPIIQHNNALYFYGESTTSWYYDPEKKTYRHITNHYSRRGYYLLSDTPTPGVLLMQEQVPTASTTAPEIAHSYDALHLYEQDKYAPKQSGRLLFGEQLSSRQPRRILIDLGKGERAHDQLTINYAYMARPFSQGMMTLTLDGQEIASDKISLSEDHSSRDYLSGIYHLRTLNEVSHTSNILNLEATYGPSDDPAYLDFFEFIFDQKLRYNMGTQMDFRRMREGNPVVLFQIEGLNDNGVIIATGSGDSSIPYRVKTSTGSNTLSFPTSIKDQSGQPYNFVACAWQDAYQPHIEGSIANQDLHTAPIPDLIIISSDPFVSEAERLAEFHRSKDGLQVLVMSESALFNEFNGGTPDATAYRLMAKYYYDQWVTAHSGGGEVCAMQLLLFGDGAADNRRISADWESMGLQNTPFLLTYQSVNSLNINSYTTDDYFGYLRAEDDAKTNGSKELSIGIGRFPVRTLSEARAAVDKSIRYAENRDPGVWKTRSLFVADNKDSYSHAEQAEELTNLLTTLQPELMISKVYLDAFPKSTVNGLTTVPTAKRKLFDALDQGLLLLNYTGHGSPTAWTDEQIMTLSDVQRLDNKRLPIWITATCDFCPYDNSATSAGERAFLNEKGGAAALFTTTRVVFDIPNQEINKQFLRTLFSQDSQGELHQLGDVLRVAKNKVSDTINKLNFALMGDPALRLKMPTHRVTLSKINGEQPDPSKGIKLHALERVTLEGAIHDLEGTVDGNFYGMLAITVFDAEQTSATLEENIPEYQEEVWHFTEYPSIIYAGNTEVQHGYFKTSFIVPKDVTYSDKSGKINFYAYSTELKREAMGVDHSLKIEKGASEVEEDTTPPTIEKMYLNDTTLTAPIEVGPTPLFVAELFDVSGINLSAGGVGHGITLAIDNNPSYTYQLNEYYQANQLEAGKGSVVYLLPTLPEGDHKAVLTVWDVFNNRSEKEIEFRVNKDLTPLISVSQAYPNPAIMGMPITFEIGTNTPGEEMNVVIELFDFTGRCVAQSPTFNITTPTQGSIKLLWTPTTSYQTYPTEGLYIYRCTLSGKNQKHATAGGKIVLTAGHTPTTE